MWDSPTEREFNATLTTGLRMLTAIQINGGSLSAKAIIDAVGVPRSTGYRILHSLVTQGWAVVNNGRYATGPMLNLASRNPAEEILTSPQADPIMVNLSQKTGETCIVTVVRWPEALALKTIDGPQPIRYSFSAGSRHPLTAGASALVLLANLPPGGVDAVIAHYASNAQVSSADIKSRLEKVATRGYALSCDEVDHGVSASAVPLLEKNGQLAAGLSIVGPSFRFDPGTAVPFLMEAKHELESLLEEGRCGT